MNFEAFRDLVKGLPTFSARDATTLSEQSASSVAVNLNRWVSSGRIERLRRGLYTLRESDRQARLPIAYLASVLVEPSYLSGVWILSQDSVIPEAVFTITSATRGRKLGFENTHGRFTYQRLPSRAWFGYFSQEIGGYDILIANSEKALLDTIYWSGSSWDRKRFQQERVNADGLNEARLNRYACRWGNPKLEQSLSEFKAYKELTCPTW